MQKIYVVMLAAAMTALSSCSLLRWSGHTIPIAGLSGVRPDTSPPVPPGKEATPFINNIPLTLDEYTKAARLYLDLAGKYRQEAASHRAMKRLYEGIDPAMAAQCERLFLQLSALADQCEKISRAHEQKAEALKKPEK